MPIDNQNITGKPGADTGNPGIAVPPPPLKKAKGKKGEIKLNKVPKNLKDIVDISPKTSFQPEAKERHAVMTFGRMNPPTTGHEKLIHATHKVARKMGTKAHIVLSHSHDKKNNPLPQKHKINYVKKIHPGVHVTGSDKQNPSFLHHAKKLHQAGHDHLHVVAGSDRTGEYHKILHKYNGHKDHYNFKSITVHSAGQRDPDSHGTAGISGTKMRAHAHAGDHKSFHAGLPKNLKSHAHKIMKHITESYEDIDLLEWFETLSDVDIDNLITEDVLQEELINERVMTLLQRRKAGIKMRRLKFRIQRARKLKKKRMATKDMLVRRARRQARTLIRKRLGGAKGAKYSALSPSERIQLDKRVAKKQAIINKIATRLMPKVKSAELKRLSKARGRKNESVNHSFERFIADMVHEGTSEDNGRWSFKEYIDNAPAGLDEAESAERLKKQKELHNTQDAKLDKRQDLAREKLKVQISKEKQADIRREAFEVAGTVDMMIEAIEALDAKAEKANMDPDVLFHKFVEGYNNPHGKQTPQQGGFAAVNNMIAEMSQAEKDKAEDIVKGMKKKASDFTKRYGDKAKSVMYATANKLAQEDYKSLKSFGEREELRDLDEKSKGLWANIHAKRKRGEKMNPKGHPDAPTPSEIKKAQEEVDNTFIGKRGKQLTPQEKARANAQHKQKARDEIKQKMSQRKMKEDYINNAFQIFVEKKDDRTSKMTQLFRMGLAKKGELEIMKRAMKRGPDALKDPKLRTKLYELLDKIIDIVTTDGQIFVKLRQNVQNSKAELQAVEEMLSYVESYEVQNIDLINSVFEDFVESININEDMSGMSVGSGHKRSVDQGAGMTKKGVAAYRRRNPGSKLKTAVTTPPSKLKKGSKAANRRKAFCARSRSWDGERGRAARRRWNC